MIRQGPRQLIKDYALHAMMQLLATCITPMLLVLNHRWRNKGGQEAMRRPPPPRVLDLWFWPHPGFIQLVFKHIPTLVT